MDDVGSSWIYLCVSAERRKLWKGRRSDDGCVVCVYSVCSYGVLPYGGQDASLNMCVLKWERAVHLLDFRGFFLINQGDALHVDLKFGSKVTSSDWGRWYFSHNKLLICFQFHSHSYEIDYSALCVPQLLGSQHLVIQLFDVSVWIAGPIVYSLQFHSCNCHQLWKSCWSLGLSKVTHYDEL